MPETKKVPSGAIIVGVLTPRRRLSLGAGGVEHISEHAAQGEGDRWYYDVYFRALPDQNKHMVRLFDVMSAEFDLGEAYE